ncbi:MAG: hypothetical protein KAT46_05395 [Deltaproteobacteria bacterium]|nr:hypothetical protein [Deltaproteobacteria bacterium]
MTDFLDKAILLGLGVEKKLKDIASEFSGDGDTETKDSEGEEKLPPRERLENAIVSDGTAAIKELITLLKEGKDKVENEFLSGTESLGEKLNIATKVELDTVKEMARVAREKVDSLEKRLDKLEENRAKEN